MRDEEFRGGSQKLAAQRQRECRSDLIAEEFRCIKYDFIARNSAYVSNHLETPSSGSPLQIYGKTREKREEFDGECSSH